MVVGYSWLLIKHMTFVFIPLLISYTVRPEMKDHHWCSDRSNATAPAWHYICFFFPNVSQKRGCYWSLSLDDSSLSPALVFVESSSGLKSHVLLLWNTSADHITTAYDNIMSPLLHVATSPLVFFQPRAPDIYLLSAPSLSSALPLSVSFLAGKGLPAKNPNIFYIIGATDHK